MANPLVEHTRTYLESGGREGHIFDGTSFGAPAFVTTLLLETVGRRTGKRRIRALQYGDIGGEVAVVASKGGSEHHPAWYLNLREMDEVTFQIATQAFRATWREPQGEEKAKIWAFMDENYPNYPAYRERVAREIPLILLKPLEEVEVLKP